MNIDINALLTDYGNGSSITTSQRKFLETCKQIHDDYGRPFSCHDFENMSGTYFRQMLFKLHNFIELSYKSKPCFYRLRGTPFKKPFTKVTHRPTGDDMIRILSKLREQHPKIHDIKLKCNSDLHKYLVAKGHEPHPNNLGIKLKYHLDDQIFAKASVYPSMIQTDIGCTSNPIIYDISGVIHLNILLGKFMTLLQLASDNHALFSPIPEWIVTHYHFGKDFTEDYSGAAYHLTYSEVATGLIRFYSKNQEKDLTTHRFEQIQTPHTALNRELDTMIAQQIPE